MNNSKVVKDTENQISLRPYQDEAVGYLIESIQEGENHPVCALPTGAGKSLVIGDLVARLIKSSPNIKILILSHVKEILEQNYKTLTGYLTAPIGLYSAGLGSRTIENITVAGIQSVYEKDWRFRDVDIVIIDEAHLVPTKGEGMYRSFLKSLNDVIHVGLTATHFRLSHGFIHEGEGALFTELAYDMTDREGFKILIENGWLSKIISKATDTFMDMDGIRTTAGDFNMKDMSIVFDRDLITDQIVEEIIKFGKNYKKWLIFAIDIKHADHITEQLNKNGIKTVAIHSKMDLDRDETIEDFRNGEYRCAVNVDILTTGFDVPDIDLVAMLRPTKSPNIHVQTVGRGMRIAPNKDHCLFLDFAGNTTRLGPIDDIKIQQKGKKKRKGEPITKTCPECKVIHHPSVRVCDVCDHHFEFKHKLSVKPSDQQVLGGKKTWGKTPNDLPEDWQKVTDIFYSVHQKYGAPSSMKVVYQCGLYSYTEWICIDHEGWAKSKADSWIRYRLGYVPMNLKALMNVTHLLKKPKAIKVKKNGKFTNIVDSQF